MQPQNVDILLQRAEHIAGMSVLQLASALAIPLPYDLKCAKGFIGQLVEVALGATAGSKPTQDFPHLGIELKTIPITLDCKPAENTHVCALHTNVVGQDFAHSNFLNKIKKVLWVLVESDRSIPLPERRIGVSYLWTISPEEYHELEVDWNEIMEQVTLGNLDNISSKMGTWMQVKPAGYSTGEKKYGFFLRKNFTQRIIDKIVTE